MIERARYQCAVPFCRHTTGRFDPAVSEWLCGDHWRLVPAYLKKRLRVIKRLERKNAAIDFRPQLATLWDRAKARAIERAMGIGIERAKLPNRRRRTPLEFEHGGNVYVGGAGHYADGSIGEVFLSAGKSGTQLQIATSDAAICASLALQFGCPISVLSEALLRNEDGSPAGPLGVLFEILKGRER